jgi:hypothetical protein
MQFDQSGFQAGMAQFVIIVSMCAEWIIVAKIASTMVSGGITDERAFSALNCISNDLYNRLDTNLEAYINSRIHLSDPNSRICSPLPHFLMNSCRQGSRLSKFTTGCIERLNS